MVRLLRRRLLRLWGGLPVDALRIRLDGEDLSTASPAASDGGGPYGGLIFDASGNLYGSNDWWRHRWWGHGLRADARQWGQLDVSPRFTASPEAVVQGLRTNLVMDAAGNLYGTTYGDGAYNVGSVFKLTPSTAVGRTPRSTISPAAATGHCRIATWYSTRTAISTAPLWADGAYGGCGTVWEITP